MRLNLYTLVILCLISHYLGADDRSCYSPAVSGACEAVECGVCEETGDQQNQKDFFGIKVYTPPIPCPQYYDESTSRESLECRALAKECRVPGTWLPQLPPLFRPFIADPRQITSSAGLRLDDTAIAKKVAAVSYGDIVPLYRWYDRWPWGGQLEFGLEGALWAVFDPGTYSAPLVNADYYIGGYFAYAWRCLQFRLRGYHISSHIGDEFLLNHPCFDRRNPSAEYLDLFVSWNIVKDIRLYAGFGGVVHQDASFKIGRWFWEAGMEVRVYQLGFIDCGSRIYGTPFYAMDFRLRKDYKNHIDATYALGYEWGTLYGTAKRLRGYLEYHDGYSAEGQFSRVATNYLSVKVSYGF